MSSGSSGDGWEQAFRLVFERSSNGICLVDDTPQIARELHIAESTVKTHVRNAMFKLGARTRAQLVAISLCREGTLQVRHLEATAL